MLHSKVGILSLLALAPALTFASPFNDWQPTCAPEYLCKGFYAPSLHGFEDSLTLKADQIEFHINKEVYLKGDVALFWQQHEIHAQDIHLIQDNDKHWQYLTTKRPFLYQTPLWAFYGENATFARQPEYIRLDNAQFRYYPHHAHGGAHLLEATKESLLLQKASYTTCHPDNPTWKLSAKSIKLKPEIGRASARNITFRIHDVPVFYWPYINYPIDKERHSGFLFPSYGSLSQTGFFVTVPYYWNIAPNKDALFAARYMSERGLEWQTKLRYLTPHHHGSINWHILIDDDKFDEFQRQNLLSPPTGIAINDPRIKALDNSTTRQGLNWLHHSNWGDHWQGLIQFEWVSDDNYFVDLGQDLHTSSQNQLPQRARITYQGTHWYHELGLEEYQILQPLSSTVNEELYKRQPHWHFFSYYPDFWHDFSFALEGQVVNFTHGPDPKSEETVTTGNRSYFKPKLSYLFNCDRHYLNPNVALHWRYYDLQRGEQEKTLPNNQSSFIPEYTVDGGMYFERPFTFGESRYTQTLEPRVFYVYIPHKDQDSLPVFDGGIISYLSDMLYSPNRFLGKDRIGDTHHVTVGLQSRVFQHAPYSNHLKLELAQIFYFKARTEQLCERALGSYSCYPTFEQLGHNHSDLLFALDWRNRNLHAGFWTQWDILNANIEQSAVYADYAPNKRTRVNAYYTWVRQDFTPQPDLTTYRSNLQQLDLSGYFSLHARWQMLFRSLIDLKYNQFADLLVGFEYNSCCMGLQILGSRYRQPNNLSQDVEYANGVFLQIAFKGLSTIGLNQADNHIKNKIPGYTPFGDRVKSHVVQPRSML